MYNIVLVNPQIPQNTGNIGRICVNTNSKLHIVLPIGFHIDEKSVKRAGLDYWDELDLSIWESLEQFVENCENKGSFHIFSTKATKYHYQINPSIGDFLIFGSETSGVPEWFFEKFKFNSIKIPMSQKGRSLNLSVSVGIGLYEALRHNGVEYF